MEAQRHVEKVRELRVNRYVYGDIVKQMAGFMTHVSHDKLPKQSPSTEKELLHFKELEEVQLKKELGNKYLKQSIELAKEILASPRLSSAKPPDKIPDESRLFITKVVSKASKRGLSKEESKKYYNVHDIFKRRDKVVDDKGNNYSKLEAIRMVDCFTSPETQFMAVKAIKSIDHEIKMKEREIKNGIARDDDIEQDYLRSIKTKLEVINQRVAGVQNAFEGRAQSSQPYKNSISSELKKKREEMKQQRAKSALRPALNKVSEREHDEVTPRHLRYPAAGDKRERLNSQEHRDSNRAREPRVTKPFSKDSPLKSSAEDLKKKGNSSGRDQPLGNLPYQDKIAEKSHNDKPNFNLNSKRDAPKGPSVAANAQGDNKAKPVSKEIHLPVANGTLNSLNGIKKSDPVSPANTGEQAGKQALLKEDLNHPLIKKLSEDLDEDPSESINISQQKRKQQELGEFFDQKHKRTDGTAGATQSKPAVVQHDRNDF